MEYINELVEDFKDRLIPILKPETTFVVCGFIAQAFFCLVLKKLNVEVFLNPDNYENFWEETKNEPKHFEHNNSKMKFLFINHPCEWDKNTYENKIEVIKKMI